MPLGHCSSQPVCKEVQKLSEENRITKRNVCEFHFCNGLQDYNFKSCENLMCNPIWSNGTFLVHFCFCFLHFCLRLFILTDCFPFSTCYCYSAFFSFCFSSFLGPPHHLALPLVLFFLVVVVFPRAQHNTKKYKTIFPAKPMLLCYFYSIPEHPQVETTRQRQEERRGRKTNTQEKDKNNKKERNNKKKKQKGGWGWRSPPHIPH